MFPYLVEGFDCFGLVVPDKQLAFQDTMLLDSAFSCRNTQAILEYTMKTHTIHGGVLSALGEDFDAVTALGHVNMNLAVLAIVLAFKAHMSALSHLTAVLDTSGFVVWWHFDHYTDLRNQLAHHAKFERSLAVPCWSRWQLTNSRSTENRHSGIEGTLKVK